MTRKKKKQTLCFITFLDGTEYSLIIDEAKAILQELFKVLELFEYPTIDSLRVLLNAKKLEFKMIKARNYLIDVKYKDIEKLDFSVLNI